MFSIDIELQFCLFPLHQFAVSALSMKLKYTLLQTMFVRDQTHALSQKRLYITNSIVNQAKAKEVYYITY